MNSIDLSPLYRSMVGFDRLASMIDEASQFNGVGGYPPYNIEHLDENEYAIEIAVAGFAAKHLDIEIKQGVLIVAGDRKENGDERRFLHRGIAERSFLRRFQLADHVQVTGADLTDGMLRIELRRELPEAMKPRKITIGGKHIANK